MKLKKNSKYSFAVAVAAAFLVAPITAQAYTVNNDYAFSSSMGDTGTLRARQSVTIHATGNLGPSAENTAIYEHREWNSSQAYVTDIVGADNNSANGKNSVDFKVGQEDYPSWGVGYTGNQVSVAQIELAETSDWEQFRNDYATYIQVIINYCDKYSLPRDLDTGYGVNSHNYFTQTYGETDHTDPYGYLSSWGVSKAQLQQDLYNGYSSVGGETEYSSQPSTSTTQSSNSSTTTAQSSGTWTDNDGTVVYYEDGYFTPYYEMNDRWYPGGALTPYSTIGSAYTIHYFGYAIKDGSVWVAYVGNDGYVHYIADKDIASGSFYGSLK